MNATHTRFLAQLDRELGALPDGQRSEILDDVESHINDALDEGRDIDEILAGLGTPREAAKAYVDELGAYAAETGGRRSADPVQRTRSWLARAALAVGLLTTALTPVLAPGVIDALGLGGGVMVFATPAVIGALPIVLPHKWMAMTALAMAIISSVTVVAGLFTSGNLVMLTALAAVLWALVIAPAAVRSRGSARVALRIVGGILVGAPGLGAFGSAVDITLWGALIGVAVIALGVLVACGLRFSYWLVLALGVVVAIWSLFDAGMLMWAFWTIGGLWIALGLTAIVGHRR